MRFLFYFRLSSYFLIASGFLALIVTDDYGILSAIIFALIIVIGWKVDSGKLTFPPHHPPALSGGARGGWWWNLATIAFLCLCIADALFLRQIKSIALVNFLIFLQTTKIFTPKQHRDYVMIYVISFFELLISSIMTVSILFAVSCIFFAISTTWALITLYLKREIETHIIQKADRSEVETKNAPQMEQASFNIPPVNTLLNVKFFTATFGLTLLTFILALIVFTIMPRMQEGVFFRYGTDFSQRVSGFSGEVALDTFGKIRLDHRPVMRVVLPEVPDQGQLPEKFYWKGLSYNYYDGKRWKSDVRSWKHLPVQSRYQKLYWFNWQPSTDNLLTQRFELFSPRFEVVFGSDRLYAVEGKFLSLQHDKVTDNTHVIFDPYSLNYTAYSEITIPAEEELRSDRSNYPDRIKDIYLQLPDLSERVKELAYQIGDGYDTAYDTSLAIQNFLMQNYEYSLDVQRTADLLPLEDFLFINKAGHCEYYATSMAILLRILGIPTRVVNGFAQGRWNEFGNFFTVRRSDAHAWVEVFFPSYGWIAFDPTPAVAFGDTYQQFAERKSFVASLYRYSEYLRVRWNRYIVDYSREDQAQAIFRAFMATRSARRNLRDSISRLKQHLKNTVIHISWREIGFLAGIISAGLLFIYVVSRMFTRFHIRLPGFRKRKKTPRKKIIGFYHTMLQILAKKGISKQASSTPGEFAQYVAQQHVDYGNDVCHITDVYYALRYGHTNLTREELFYIERLLKKMRKKPRNSKVAK